MAGIGAISAVSNFFAAAVDDTDLGIGIAVNSLWIWMIPVTLGFVWVGTQRSANAVREALMSSEACLSEKGASQVHKEARLIKNRMIGFRDRTGDESMCVQSDIEAGKSLGERPPPASMLGISHAGFELEPGPIFNYARIWSYRNTAQAVIDAFAVLNARLESKQPVRETEKGWNCDPHQWKDNLEGSPEEMEAYIYPPGYQEVSCGNYSMTWHCILAAFVGVVLQWGTTGAAILTAYNTPVVGLGCESGSYLLYGTLATFSWALLVLSAYLSHKYTSSIRTSVLPRAMGRNASAASAISSIELQSLLPAQTTVTGPSPTDAQHLPSRQTTPFLPALIILTRFSGLLLAILNAFWLLLISTLQFTNLYDNCWCEGCVLGLGSKAWVILWASDAQIVAAAQESWIFAVAMSAVAVVFAGGFFIVMRGEEVLRKQ
ncbi:hypothetical protein MMC13_008031 [Lambiella insularis]|nr:hypothetical protein [Lambiella insularis]